MKKVHDSLAADWKAQFIDRASRQLESIEGVSIDPEMSEAYVRQLVGLHEHLLKDITGE